MAIRRKTKTRKTSRKAGGRRKGAVAKALSKGRKAVKRARKAAPRTVKKATKNVRTTAKRARELGDTVVATGEAIKQGADIVDSIAQRVGSRKRG